LSPFAEGARWRCCGIALAWALAATAGCASHLDAGRVATGESPSIFGAPWTWTTEEGRPVAFARWRGTTLVVAPIYASCTERCPRTIEKLRRVDQAFARRGVARQVILVTLDPRDDGLERLRRFRETRQVPGDWAVLRGDGETTRALARALGVHAIWDDAHIDHDVRIAVFDGAGSMVRNFGGWDFDDEDAVVAP
jgi:protein SCO1/2